MKNLARLNFILAILSILFIASAPSLSAEETASSNGPNSTTVSAAEKPVLKMQAVYVMDFSLDGSEIKNDEGVLGKTGIKRRLPVLSRGADSSSKAEKFINLMSVTMVEKFASAGLKASRITKNEPLPAEGILIKGDFTNFDEGSRLKRSTVGFGKGAVKIDAYVTVYDLAKDKDSPVLILGDNKGSRKTPGAVVTMNPYAAAAKFVLEKNASAKTVKRLAGDIADEVLKYRAQPEKKEISGKE